MTEVRVGVVIPTLNSAGTLRTALLSVTQQAGCSATVVVADSGSTDGTLDICTAYGSKVLYVPPGNMYAAINHGVRNLPCSWIAYLNSDDFVYSNTYERLVNEGVHSEADVVYGRGDYVDSHGRFLYSLSSPRPQDLSQLFKAQFFPFMPHAAVFRKEVFDELRGFDETFRHIADMEFFGRACFAGKRFALVEGASVAAFRIHATQLSARESTVVMTEKAQLRTRWNHGNAIAKRLCLTKWKITNAHQYLLRWLRTGSLRRPQ